MSASKLRDQVKELRHLASIADDDEIERRITALADEFEAKAVQADASETSAQPKPDDA